MFDPYFVAVASIAVLLVGLSKSGLLGSLGVVGVPLLTLVMPAREAAGMMLPVLLAMDCIAVYAYRKEFSWNILKVMLPGAAIGTIIGWILWSFVSDAAVLLFVGIVTLLFVLDAMLPLRKKLEGLPPSTPWGVFWGGFSGFTSFVSHTGGPPFQIYVLPQRLAPALYSGTTAVFFGIVNTAKLIPYFFLGQLSVHNLELSAALIPVGIIGVLLGIYLVRRISAKYFYQIAYVLVFFLALKLIWDGAQGVFFAGTLAG
ncbi:MAG: sulfite exporter TauE/SafE family protein [Devosia sp.]|uniref:sulfite exporter TauE/SafE family protein n=1 Tax=Devosia sp. TaxID=1871048 RepID=UPI0026129DBC|nr:sulfite exporter TauE/SafE family protein [Devosia sp.]MDB5527167.1 sulfite exporter TauE/SafE family protein [Devosia sp.]